MLCRRGCNSYDRAPRSTRACAARRAACGAPVRFELRLHACDVCPLFSISLLAYLLLLHACCPRSSGGGGASRVTSSLTTAAPTRRCARGRMPSRPAPRPAWCSPSPTTALPAWPHAAGRPRAKRVARLTRCTLAGLVRTMLTTRPVCAAWFALCASSTLSDRPPLGCARSGALSRLHVHRSRDRRGPRRMQVVDNVVCKQEAVLSVPLILLSPLLSFCSCAMFLTPMCLLRASLAPSTLFTIVLYEQRRKM